jgi:hypothetical protein
MIVILKKKIKGHFCRNKKTFRKSYETLLPPKTFYSRFRNFANLELGNNVENSKCENRRRFTSKH